MLIKELFRRISERGFFFICNEMFQCKIISPPMKRIAALVLLLGVLVQTSCQKTEIPLPQGVQTVRGFLQHVPFSLKRRGTHAIYTASGGAMIAYAESATVNLSRMDGQEVELEGILEKNTSSEEYPVLVVQKILQGYEQMRPWKIPALGLSLSVPIGWKGTIKGNSATFTASESIMPVLTVAARKELVAPQPSRHPLYGPLAVSSLESLSVSVTKPNEEHLVVGFRKARAYTDSEGFWVVRIAPPALEGLEIVFRFPPPSVELHLIPYRNILKTVEFNANTNTASSARITTFSSAEFTASAGSTSRASGAGATCGGLAGILCPRGLFCKITDPLNESGVCTAR